MVNASGWPGSADRAGGPPRVRPPEEVTLARFSFTADHNPVRSAWDRLHRLPGGKLLFSRLIGRLAPYTGNLRAVVVELEPGRSRVEMADRPALRNHLNSVHAIALANLAELTGNLALAYSMPPGTRFIVSGMELTYVKKARGRLTGRCECVIPTSNARQEVRVPVTLHDASGAVVVQAELRTLLGPVS